MFVIHVASLKYTTDTRLISSENFELNLFIVLEPPTAPYLLKFSGRFSFGKAAVQVSSLCSAECYMGEVFCIIIKKESHNIIIPPMHTPLGFLECIPT